MQPGLHTILQEGRSNWSRKLWHARNGRFRVYRATSIRSECRRTQEEEEKDEDEDADEEEALETNNEFLHEEKDKQERKSSTSSLIITNQRLRRRRRQQHHHHHHQQQQQQQQKSFSSQTKQNKTTNKQTKFWSWISISNIIYKILLSRSINLCFFFENTYIIDLNIIWILFLRYYYYYYYYLNLFLNWHYISLY